ncbi:MAG: hypothetical protein KAQ64_02370 [Candidatus Pacebacteria bacterium]|nr:hypothetical protein [Candidatus Paceibacterota bacterium]
MKTKLENWKIGYAAAILDSIGAERSIKKEKLFEFSNDIIMWLVGKDLLRFTTMNIDGFEERRAALTTRSRPFWDGTKLIDEKIEILNAINREVE